MAAEFGHRLGRIAGDNEVTLAKMSRRLTGRFRSATVETRLPRYLIVLLAVGCTVLFGFFLVPAAQFKNVQPLFAKGERPAVQKEPRSGDGLDAKAPETRIPVQVVGLESAGENGNGEDPRSARLQQARIATNILIRSGYVASASIRIVNFASPPEIQYVIIPEDNVLECARLEPDQTGDANRPNDPAATGNAASGAASAADDAAAAKAEADRLQTAQRLALAAVAVEKFHRTALHRSLEWLYARGYRAVFGRLPDLSFGPAQIRPSRVRQLARAFDAADPRYKVLRDSEADLPGVLTDECKSLNLAATIMYFYLKRSDDCDKANLSDCPEYPVDFAARMYNGQHRTTSAVIDYAPVVAQMVEEMANQMEPAASPPGPEPAVASPAPAQDEPSAAAPKPPPAGRAVASRAAASLPPVNAVLDRGSTPTSAPPHLPSTARGAFRTYLHRDLSGGDLNVIRNTTQQACESSCLEASDCRAYSFDRWNRLCILKSAVSSLTLSPKSITGVRQGAAEPDMATVPVRMDHYRQKSFIYRPTRTLRNSSEASCERACMMSASCVAYTFFNRDSICNTFDDTGEYSLNSGADSGVKAQRP